MKSFSRNVLLSIKNRFRNFSRKTTNPTEIQQIYTDLLEESTTDLSYLTLIVGSCIIATFGLLLNSTTVIIGAMIIAPLMLPIRGLAFAALQGSVILFKKAAIAIVVGTLIAIIISAGLALLVHMPSYGSEVLSRSKPTLLDLGIAVAAGSISGYAKIQPKISSSLAGTAIAVALMPPICVVGLGFSQANWSLSLGATLLYLTNLLGITLACMLIFLLAGYASLSRAQKPLFVTLALTAIMVIPLGISFAQLLQQAQLETTLRYALLDKTVTFHQLQLVSSDINWLTNPPQVHLNVRANTSITPKQVELLEKFIQRQMGQPFALIFDVSRVKEVRAQQNVAPE